MTGDVNIDAVLSLFDAVGTATFTAEYTGVLTFDGTSTPAAVAQDSTPSSGPSPSARCDSSAMPPVIAPAWSTPGCANPRSSRPPSQHRPHAGVRRGRHGQAPPSRRRRQGRRHHAVHRHGSRARGHIVDVPVTGGIKQYCAFTNGVLARFVGGDVTIDVVSITDTADPALFEASAS